MPSTPFRFTARQPGANLIVIDCNYRLCDPDTFLLEVLNELTGQEQNNYRFEFPCPYGTWNLRIDQQIHGELAFPKKCDKSLHDRYMTAALAELIDKLHEAVTGRQVEVFVRRTLTIGDD